ncbi:MAG: thioredoxin family protein [Thaumarchaeota archaeon]|nr:thioredoxin family protein [Nitrososphaerota archaeon]
MWDKSIKRQFCFKHFQSLPLEVTNWLGKDDFVKLKNSAGTHYFLFAAKWCGFCTRFLEQARSLERPDHEVLSLVNTDDPDESLWDEYSIKVVPTLIVVKDGTIILRKDARLGMGLKITELSQALSQDSS